MLLGPELLNKLLVIDLENLSFDKVEVTRHERCPACGKTSTDARSPPRDRFFEEECGRSGKRTFVVTPKKPIQVNLKDLLGVLQTRGAIITADGDLGVTFDYGAKVTVSILKSGVMIAQVPAGRQVGDPREDVIQVYHSIMVEDLQIDSEALPGRSDLALS